MSALITIIHVLICVVLIIAVLLQSGKAADLAGAFGGVGSQTAFGSRGTASLLSKVTTISAILFMVTSLGLWILSGRGGSSAVKGQKETPLKSAAGTTAAEPKKETPSQTSTQAAPAAASEKKQPETKQPEVKKPDSTQQKTVPAPKK